ncbi:MAG: hypothetical protein J5515_00900 [Lachnospiraceae bacterium]|nr:hypothetical protein [Lachnospiraceae bacterium]
MKNTKENGNIKQFKKKNTKDKLFDEFNKKRAGHEINKMMWVSIGILAFVLIVAAVFIVSRVFFINKEYVGATEVASTEFFISTGSKVQRFGNNFIVYNSDGIKCVNYKGEQIWNEAFQMQKPLVDMAGDIVAVADYNGGTIYVMDEKNVLGKIDTGMPIRKFKASGNGYIMAVLDGTSNTPIYVYNTSGEEMLFFNTTMKGFGYPLEIAISQNGLIGAVSYLNVDKGSFYSTVGFYNFGEVGQNYQDNLVSSYIYQGALVPEIRFAGNSKAVAVADNRIMFYSGDQMPRSEGESLLSEKIISLYEDDKYVALFYESDTVEHKYKAEIYDYDAKLKDKMYFDIDYTDVFFDDNRIVLYNNEEVLIHMIGGKDKFLGNFDDGILALIPTSSSKRFIQVTPNRIKTIEFN